MILGKIIEFIPFKNTQYFLNYRKLEDHRKTILRPSYYFPTTREKSIIKLYLRVIFFILLKKINHSLIFQLVFFIS